MTPRIVLGFCAEPYSPDYVFAYVLAAGHEGRLLKADFSMFPPQGSIYVPRASFPHTPARFKDLGFWDVEEDPTFAERARGAKFRAFRLRIDTPAELLRLDCASHRPEEARHALLERGLEAPYRLEDRDLLLELSDGVVIGPVRVGPVEADGRHRCDPEQLSRPLGSWPSRALVQPVILAMGQTTRWFVWPLPKPEQFLDLASTRQVIDHLMRIGLRQEQYDDLMGRLGAIDDALRLPPMHRQRLQGLLEEALKTGQQLDACVQLLEADPRMQDAVEAHKRQVGEEYRKELDRDRDRLAADLKGLEAEKARLEGELAAMRERLAGEEAEKQKLADSVAEAIVARAKQARQDVRALLAESAVLRPFLAGGAAGDGPLAVTAFAAEARPLNHLDDAYGHLKEQLESAGLRPPSSAAVAREALAALSLGQAVFFQGSLAGPLARAAAAALAGARWSAVEVPGGLTDPAPMRAALAAAAAAPGRTALVVGGANRSGLDAYAADLVRLLAERSGGAGPPGEGPMVLGVLSEGIDAAPPDAVLSALGPILHTDYLDWRKGGKAAPVRPGQLTAWDWPHRDGPDEPALADLLDALQPAPNELWRRNVQAAFRRLNGWAVREGPGAREAVLFGWVLPRALAAGVDMAEHDDTLRQLLPDDDVDPRLQRLLRMHGVEVGV
jgi:hypothetical protein